MRPTLTTVALVSLVFWATAVRAGTNTFSLLHVWPNRFPLEFHGIMNTADGPQVVFKGRGSSKAYFRVVGQEVAGHKLVQVNRTRATWADRAMDRHDADVSEVVLSNQTNAVSLRLRPGGRSDGCALLAVSGVSVPLVVRSNSSFRVGSAWYRVHTIGTNSVTVGQLRQGRTLTLEVNSPIPNKENPNIILEGIPKAASGSRKPSG